MIGFILGAACAVGLARAIRSRRRGVGRGHGGGFGGPGRRGFLRSLVQRRDTTPGQEKVIVGALDELRTNRGRLRDEMVQTRQDLARAVEGGLITDSSLDDAFARHDRLVAELRVSFVEAIKKATEALDDEQRKQVARVIEGRGFFRGSPVWA